MLKLNLDNPADNDSASIAEAERAAYLLGDAALADAYAALALLIDDHNSLHATLENEWEESTAELSRELEDTKERVVELEEERDQFAADCDRLEMQKRRLARALAGLLDSMANGTSERYSAGIVECRHAGIEALESTDMDEYLAESHPPRKVRA